MAKFNFFGLFKRKSKQAKDEIKQEKKEVLIDEMSFEELNDTLMQCKVDEVLFEYSEKPATKEQIQELNQKISLINSSIAKLIKNNDPDAVEHANKIVESYIKNCKTIKTLKMMKKELETSQNRKIELEYRLTFEPETCTKHEEVELESLRYEAKRLDRQLENLTRHIECCEEELSVRKKEIADFEIKSAEIEAIEMAEINEFVKKTEKQNNSEKQKDDEQKSNGDVDVGIQPGE